MRRFRFRAEVLLRLARHRRRMARMAVAQALRQRHAAESGLRQADRARQAAGELLWGLLRPKDDPAGLALAHGSGGIEGFRLAAALELWQQADQRQQRWRMQLLEADRRLQAESERLLQAHRRVRVLERLRERQRARFVAEQLRREARLLDELATRAWERARTAPDVPGPTPEGSVR